MSTIKEILYGGPQPVARKNFIRENVKQLREMRNYHSNKTAGFPGLGSNITQCTCSKPRSKSAHPRSRDQSLRTSVTRLDRPVTAFGSNANIAKQPVNRKAGLVNGNGSSLLDQARVLAARHERQKEDVVGHKTQPCKISRQNSNLGKSANCCCVGKGQASCHRDATTVSSVAMYTNSSSQTLETQNIDELYKEGVVVYPSSSALTNKGTGLDKPIRIDSASQTDRDSRSAEICARLHNIPSNQICNDDIDHLNFQAMNLDECKENVQDQRNSASSSRRSSSKQKCAQTSNDSLKPPASYQKGVVPRYLRERQQQQQQALEEERANAPDPCCPPDHVLLPEEERLQTLHMVKRDYANMIRELNMMPVRTDTLRQRQRKIEIEQKLTKLDDAIKVFSRPKVFVKIGE